MISERISAIPRKLVTTSRLMTGQKALVMNWATQGVIRHNWGDKLNDWMGRKISGLDVIHRADIYPYPPRPVLRLKFQVQHPAPAGHRMLRWINDTSTSTARNVA